MILGNGDLKDLEDVRRRVRETGVDGVLLGRAAQGNPWIFRAKEQIRQALNSDGDLSIPHVPVGLDERFGVMLEHSNHFATYQNPSSFVGMRKHLAWYCTSIPGAAELRSRMVRMNSASEVIECLSKYVSSRESTATARLGVSRRGDAWDEEPRADTVGTLGS